MNVYEANLKHLKEIYLVFFCVLVENNGMLDAHLACYLWMCIHVYVL